MQQFTLDEAAGPRLGSSCDSWCANVAIALTTWVRMVWVRGDAGSEVPWMMLGLTIWQL